MKKTKKNVLSNFKLEKKNEIKDLTQITGGSTGQDAITEANLKAFADGFPCPNGGTTAGTEFYCDHDI